MRIISGRFAGVSLDTPKSGTRPTTDRTKEALFSHLDAEGLLGPGSRVLDLFAGTGALGFEALSRGADQCVFVDKSPQAVAVLRRAEARIRHHASWDSAQMSIDIVRSRAEKAVEKFSADEPFDLVFVDPPYAMESAQLGELIGQLVERGCVSQEGEIVLERSTRSEPVPIPQGWSAGSQKRYGETLVTYIYHD